MRSTIARFTLIFLVALVAVGCGLIPTRYGGAAAADPCTRYEDNERAHAACAQNLQARIEAEAARAGAGTGIIGGASIYGNVGGYYGYGAGYYGYGAGYYGSYYNPAAPYSWTPAPSCIRGWICN